MLDARGLIGIGTIVVLVLGLGRVILRSRSGSVSDGPRRSWISFPGSSSYNSYDPFPPFTDTASSSSSDTSSGGGASSDSSSGGGSF